MKSGAEARVGQKSGGRGVRASWAFFLLLFAALSTSSGCRQAARAVISDDIEVWIGQGATKALHESYTILPDDDPTTIWARQLVAGLVEHSTHRRGYEGFGGYKVAVIDDATLVNAFAAPGGFVFLSTGLIIAAGSCAEVAGVIGHELAHVTERHGIDGLADRIAINIGAFALGQGSELLASLGAGLLESGFSRAQERQADEVGLDIMIRAGYNPRGIVNLFDTLDEVAPSSGGFGFFSSHPETSARKSFVRESVGDRVSDEDYESDVGMHCRGTDESFEDVQTRLAPPRRYLR